MFPPSTTSPEVLTVPSPSNTERVTWFDYPGDYHEVQRQPSPEGKLSVVGKFRGHNLDCDPPGTSSDYLVPHSPLQKWFEARDAAIDRRCK
jgi:hypothetical protein